MKSAARYLLLLSLPLYVADQVTKWLVLQHINPGEVIPVIPGILNFVQVHNTGAAFGMLKDSNTFFLLFGLLALVVLAILAGRGAFSSPLSRMASALLVSGIFGNLTDRLLHGFVVDFLDVILPWYGHWPAFNIADSCICVAAALFLLEGFLPGKSGASTKTLPAE
ncbi:MAG: signal peptidase II [Chthoniobacterales bacterium]|nr:signal peptidase II [Chthoniobacterales bacterium]